MTMAGSRELPNGDPKHLEHAIEDYLKAMRPYVARRMPECGAPKRAMERLGLTREKLTGSLCFAAMEFLDNRLSDKAARTDRGVIEALQVFTGCSDEAVEELLDGLLRAAVDALCGVFPGHRYAIGAYGDISEADAYLQPEHERLQAETLKNLWRRETAGPGRGLARLSMAEPVAACISADAPVDILLTLIERIVVAIETSPRREKLGEEFLKTLAIPLLEFGSLGIPAVYQAAMKHLRGIRGTDNMAAFLRETCPLIVQDLKERGTGHAGYAVVVAITEMLDRMEALDRRRVLQCLATAYPSAFRGYVGRTIDALRRQYGGAEQRGKERNTRRWIEAHAGWHLIVDVMDVVWPAELGPLDNKTKKAVTTLIQNTLFFADSGIPVESNIKDRTLKDSGRGSSREGVHNEANFAVNAEHVSAIASMRLTIFELNEIMGELDRRLLLEIEPMPDPSLAIQEEVIQLRQTVEGLQTWRRELTRRLHQGDYLKGKAGKAKRQASGIRIDVPGISLAIRQLPADERRKAICALALELWRQQAGRPGAVHEAESGLSS